MSFLSGVNSLNYFFGVNLENSRGSALKSITGSCGKIISNNLSFALGLDGNDRMPNGLPITQHQFDALLSFTYNVGTGNLARSTLLRKVKANPKDPSIRGEFSRWVYGGGKRLPGLVRRRKMEADLYFS